MAEEEGVAKEEVVEAEKLSEGQQEGEGRGNPVRSPNQTPPWLQVLPALVQPLPKIPQVMRMIVNLMWSVLSANHQNQRTVRIQSGCSVTTQVVPNGIMCYALVLIHTTTTP